MIKVEHTKKHKIVVHGTANTPSKNMEYVASNDVLVTEAKLVLVECEQKEFDKLYQYTQHPVRMQYLKPILISETERIEAGDWFYWNGTTKQIQQSVYGSESTEVVRKILALPEHFSPQQLKMITDGKLKDGDKVLVECDDNLYSSEIFLPIEKQTGKKSDIIIKLNPHITIYPIEEKMVPESKVVEFLKWKERDHSHKFETELDAWKWFEQNVK